MSDLSKTKAELVAELEECRIGLDHADAVSAELEVARLELKRLSLAAVEFEALKVEHEKTVAELSEAKSRLGDYLTGHQLRAALLHAGLFEKVNGYLNALPDDADLGDGMTGARVKFLWADLDEFDLKSEIFLLLSSNQELGLSEKIIADLAAWARDPANAVA